MLRPVPAESEGSRKRRIAQLAACPLEEALELLASSSNGLTASEAASRLRLHGVNDVAHAVHQSIGRELASRSVNPLNVISTVRSRLCLSLWVISAPLSSLRSWLFCPLRSDLFKSTDRQKRPKRCGAWSKTARRCAVHVAARLASLAIFLCHKLCRATSCCCPPVI